MQKLKGAQFPIPRSWPAFDGCCVAVEFWSGRCCAWKSRSYADWTDDVPGEAPDAALVKEIEEVRRRGYALNDEALVTGSFNVGAAVLDARGRPVAAIILAAPSDRTSKEAQQRFGEAVARAAAQLSRGQG